MVRRIKLQVVGIIVEIFISENAILVGFQNLVVGKKSLKKVSDFSARKNEFRVGSVEKLDFAVDRCDILDADGVELLDDIVKFLHWAPFERQIITYCAYLSD